MRAEAVKGHLDSILLASLEAQPLHGYAIMEALRDGVAEAAESNRQKGLGHGEAVQLALREFGDAKSLAALFWREMAAAQARRVVLALFATAPIVVALWASAARSRGSGSESGL